MLKVTPTRERINCIGGLVLTGEVLKRFGLEGNLAFLEHGCRSDRIADNAIIKTVVGLLLQGRSDFEYIELFRDDPLFPKALDIPAVLSSVSLRHRLSELARNPASFERRCYNIPFPV